MRQSRATLVPKRRSPFLPWVIGLIVFVLLLWVIASLTDAGELDTAQETELQASARIHPAPFG